jgi:hypothetical protein
MLNSPNFETVEYGYGLLLRKVKTKFKLSFRLCPGFASASYYYPKTK